MSSFKFSAQLLRFRLFFSVLQQPDVFLSHLASEIQMLGRNVNNRKLPDLGLLVAMTRVYDFYFIFVADGDGEEYEFGVTSLSNKKDFLQKGDLVQFQLEGEDRGVLRANNVKAMRTKLRSTVDHMKGKLMTASVAENLKQFELYFEI